MKFVDFRSLAPHGRHVGLTRKSDGLSSRKCANRRATKARRDGEPVRGLLRAALEDTQDALADLTQETGLCSIEEIRRRVSIILSRGVVIDASVLRGVILAGGRLPFRQDASFGIDVEDS